MAYQPKSYRKFLTGTITAAVVASAVVPAASAAEVKFTDLAGLDAETNTAIEALVASEVIKGYPDGTFKPNQTINRGQTAEMTVKALKLETPAPTGKVFEDLTDKSYYAKFAEALAKAEIIPAGGKFAAGTDMTREAMAIALVAGLKLKATDKAVEVKDLETASPEAREAIKILAQNDVTKLLDGNFNPKEAVKRSQFALFFYRAVAVAGAVKTVDANLTAATSKSFKVDFNQAVDPTLAKFEVKKAGVTVNVSKVTFADDKKSATLELSAKLTQGEYTVNVTGLTEKAITKTFTASNERVEGIEILSQVAVVDDSTTPTKATLAYKVVNQYGEDISKTTNLTTNDNTNISASNGLVTITLNGQKVGAKLAVTLINVDSSKTATAVVELSAAATVSEVTVDALYNKDNKELNEDTKFATDKYFLLVTAKDQYGNTITDVAKLKEGLILSETNPTVVATGTTANKTTFTTVTVDGKTRTAIELVAPAAGIKAGESTITLISTTTGKNSSQTVKVGEAVRTDAVSLTQPELVVVGEKALLPANVTDKKGNAVTDLKVLNHADRGVKVTVNGQNAPFILKDGLVYAEAPAAAFTGVGPVSVIAQSSSFKVATLTLTVKAAAKPAVIRGLKADYSTTLKQAQTASIGSANLVVEDQYGRVMSTAALNATLTGTTKILVKELSDTAEVLTVTGEIATTGTAPTQTTSAVTIAAAAAKKGTASLQLVLNVDGKDVNSSAADASIRVTDGSEYTSYAVDEVGTVYDVKAAGKTAADAYDAEIAVYGVLADGSKVQLDAGDDFTVTASNASVQTASADGLVEASETYTVAYGTDKTEATVAVTVTINKTGQQFKQDVTFSKSTPVVKAVNVKKGTSAVTAVTVGEADFTYASLIAAGYTVELVDQYGAKTTTLAFADGTAVAQPRVTIVPVTGAVVITGNGTETAKAASLKEGFAFDVTLTYAGGTTKTVRVNVVK
jgi:trimeric autotransporter adhesin